MEMFRVSPIPTILGVDASTADSSTVGAIPDFLAKMTALIEARRLQALGPAESEQVGSSTSADGAGCAGKDDDIPF